MQEIYQDREKDHNRIRYNPNKNVIDLLAFRLHICRQFATACKDYRPEFKREAQTSPPNGSNLALRWFCNPGVTNPSSNGGPLWRDGRASPASLVVAHRSARLHYSRSPRF
jgi:hypothetical protein